MSYEIFIDELQMQKVALHRVGNKTQDEGIRIAKHCLE